MKIAIITSGFLPIPATKGGAVENLVVNLLNENEIEQKVNFEVLSIYDKEALNECSKFHFSSFKFIKSNIFVQIADRIIFFIAKKILKKENSQSYRYIVQRLYFLHKCSIFLSKNDYDKVLLENHPSQYLALKWKHNYEKYEGKIYYHCHNSFPSTYGCDEIIRSTKKIICVSNFRKNTIEKYMNMNNSSFSILKNVIDREKISKIPTKEELNNIRKRYNINENDKIVLFIGRIVPGKGIPELISALKLIKDKNYKLLILGSSLNSLKVKNKFEEEIVKMIDNDIENKIIFLGYVNYDELYIYYHLADFAVLPSIMDDSAPLTVIEALCCGLPIITTNSGGIPEYVTESSAIILDRFSKKFIENLSNAITDLLTNSIKLEEMSKKAVLESGTITLENYYNEFLKQIDVF